MYAELKWAEIVIVGNGWVCLGMGLNASCPEQNWPLASKSLTTGAGPSL